MTRHQSLARIRANEDNCNVPASSWLQGELSKREAALWVPVLLFFICNGHCCQTQAVKCHFKGKVTSRSIRF